MKLIHQTSLRSSVRGQEHGKITAEAVLLSTDAEIVARIVAATDSFKIEKAEWESLRTGTHYASSFVDVPELIGTEAYFGAAPSLARAFPSPGQAPEKALFAECVKAVLQSETYLYRQRGFASSDAYQQNWDKTHPDSCRYYSHLDRVERRWSTYVGPATREISLFHRHKNVAVWRSDAGELKATGSFLDSFHELGIFVSCGPDGRILGYEGSFLRAPDKICFSTDNLGAGFIGKRLDEISRRETNRTLGGSEGCAHLMDLGQETLTALQKIAESFDAPKN